MKYIFLRWLFKIQGKKPTDMPMVRYWKTREYAEAKVTRDKDGAEIMVLEGEDYPITSFPRSHVLFGKLSKLKHEIKNQIFNYAWEELEKGTNEQEIIKTIKEDVYDKIFSVAEDCKYDMIPPEKMCRSVREIHRAWTKAVPSERSLKMRDIMTFILQEDDSYRHRVQDMAEYFDPNRWYMRLLRQNPITLLEKALTHIELNEVIRDMKDKQKLLKRVLMLALKDPQTRKNFLAFCKEVDWKKLYLTPGDRYHFAAKHYKVYARLFEY